MLILFTEAYPKGIVWPWWKSKPEAQLGLEKGELEWIYKWNQGKKKITAQDTDAQIWTEPQIISLSASIDFLLFYKKSHHRKGKWTDPYIWSMHVSGITPNIQQSMSKHENKMECSIEDGNIIFTTMQLLRNISKLISKRV